MNNIVKGVIIMIVIAAAIAFIIPFFIGIKHRDDSDLINKRQQFYDSLYHQLDSVKKEFSLLELKLKASNERSDTLEKIILQSRSITTITTGRKNETLRIINSNSLPELDSVMSTIDIKARHN